MKPADSRIAAHDSERGPAGPLSLHRPKNRRAAARNRRRWRVIAESMWHSFATAHAHDRRRDRPETASESW